MCPTHISTCTKKIKLWPSFPGLDEGLGYFWLQIRIPHAKLYILPNGKFWLSCIWWQYGEHTFSLSYPNMFGLYKLGFITWFEGPARFRKIREAYKNILSALISSKTTFVGPSCDPQTDSTRWLSLSVCTNRSIITYVYISACTHTHYVYICVYIYIYIYIYTSNSILEEWLLGFWRWTSGLVKTQKSESSLGVSLLFCSEGGCPPAMFGGCLGPNNRQHYKVLLFPTRQVGVLSF